MVKLITEVMLLLDAHPELAAGFHPFLPPTWTITGPMQV